MCERLFGTHPAQICFEWNTASTTALYTSVSSDFRTRNLRGVLDSSVGRALALGPDQPAIGGSTTKGGS